jgi:molybdate transport system substrate-binding protein
MSRGAQIVTVVLLAAVVIMGGLLVARGRQPEATTSVSSNSLVVYAPCGMSSPITAATHLFRQANPDIQLSVIFDNANILVKKIRNGDRPDVFMAPGELEMRQMVDEGYVDAGTVRDFGTLDMVLIAPRTTQGLDGIEGLTSPSVKAVSLADPEHSSVGYYGAEALRSLGLWEPIQTKLFLREAPLEAVTLVTTGQVDAGITYLTCPLDTAPEKADKSEVRIVTIIERELYPPVRCQVGILGEARNIQLSQEFAEFMVSEQAQQAVGENGLLPIKEIRQ